MTTTGIYKILSKKKTYYILFLINIIVGLFIFKISHKIPFGDERSYCLMSEGLLHGRFSNWYFLSKYYPETLRTPGYPVFLSICRLISASLLLPKIIQLFIYFITVYLCTRIINKITPNLVCVNLFLLLLIPNVQVVYYSGYIAAETLDTFFVVLTMFLVVSERTVRNSLLLAISCYCAFIIRPAFLLFPFVLFACFIYKNRKDIKKPVLFILSYMILLIPFGLWNKCNNGVFKVTPIEGGGGVAYLGFWELKLPDGYTEHFYWGTNTEYDLTKPAFYTPAEQQENVKKFEAESNMILDSTKKYLSKEDSATFEYMRKMGPGYFPIYNSKYTVEKEALLWQTIRKDALNDPGYYVKSCVYHFVRVYMTGINYKDLEDAHSHLRKMRVLYPFVVTLLFILGGLMLITFSAVFKKVEFNYLFAFVFLFWYYGMIHMPFSIQSRYTIPVHLLILAILAVTINSICQKKIKISNG